MFHRAQGARAAFAAAVIGLAALVAAPTVAAAPKPPPKPQSKTQVANFTIDVAGYLEVGQYHDTMVQCQVGIRYTQTTTVHFETSKPVNINLTFTPQPSGGLAISSRFTKPGGSASVAGVLSDQDSSNVCEGPPEPLPPFPNCTSTSGNFAVSFQPGDEATGELTPLNGQALALSLARLSGGAEDPSCPGTGATRFIGPELQNLMLIASPRPGTFATVPIDLRSLQLLKAKKGTVYKRSVTITGPCTEVTVLADPDPTQPPPKLTLNADGDCSMRGQIVITLVRK